MSKGLSEEDDDSRNNGITAQKMKFSIKDFFSKCDQIRSSLKNSQFPVSQFPTFTEEVLNGKLHF